MFICLSKNLLSFSFFVKQSTCHTVSDTSSLFRTSFLLNEDFETNSIPNHISASHYDTIFNEESFYSLAKERKLLPY